MDARAFAPIAEADWPDDPAEGEALLLSRAAAGDAVARLWVPGRSLVAPRSYQRHAGWVAARERFAASGSPVHLRLSGGGLVPQGPGVLNLSLAWRTAATPGEGSEAAYLFLCSLLREALDAIGVATRWQAVQGSFCDGRFNLAWGEAGHARKIAGTAQYWRPLPRTAERPRSHVVLAEAVLLVDLDLVEANERANAFEAALGTARRYDAGKIVSVAEALGEQAAAGTVMAATMHALHRAVGRAMPPSLMGHSP